MKYEHDLGVLEFAATRKRPLSPAQRARFVESVKRAAKAGKLRGPLRISTAQVLLDPAVDK